MSTPDLQSDTVPTDSAVEFGVSADGFPVARIADTLLAMVPARDGASFLASGWRLTCPLSELMRDDFHGHQGRLEDEAAFRARVFETARHKRELSALGRIQIRMVANTPWAIVALTFQDLFTAYERKSADETIRNSWPSAWETIHGRELAPGQSWTKDREAFERKHAGDWIVISAIFSSHHADMTEVIATRGGRRDGPVQEMRFLVPSAEYAARGCFGFVIDPDRHDPYDGPSSFVGWQGRVA